MLNLASFRLIFSLYWIVLVNLFKLQKPLTGCPGSTTKPILLQEQTLHTISSFENINYIIVKLRVLVTNLNN